VLQELIPSFCDELVKLGASVAQKLENHLTAEIKDWKAFEKNIKSPRFAAEVRRSSDTDQKLKDYVTANNEYRRSKDLVMKVPSREAGQAYSIKKLPNGRLGCGCKDWQYKCSWKGTDCRHITAAKAGMTKSSSAFAQGMGAMRLTRKAQKKAKAGADAKKAVSIMRASGMYG
jgi:hypothetical protein